jgi:hypothetical protein
MVMEMKNPESIHMAAQCEPGIAFFYVCCGDGVESQESQRVRDFDIRR